MAKYISIGDMVLMETRREVNRDANNIYLTFKFQPKFGTVLTKGLADAQRIFTAAIEERVSTGNWTAFKDASRDETLDAVYAEVLAYFAAADSGDEAALLRIRSGLKFYGLTEHLYMHIKSTPALKDTTLELVEA